MLSRTLIITFHGCEASLAHDLAAGKSTLQQSKNAYDWLGHGVYGWEDSPERAWQWAHEAAQKGALHEPAVIGMVIDPGNCLNLVDTEALQLVKKAYAEYQRTCQASGMPEAKNRGSEFKARFLDCAVFETLHAARILNKLPHFDTVRGFFIEGSELYPGAGLRDRDHIQLCVWNPRCIKGYFLPK
jgi:hypothetical protein